MNIEELVKALAGYNYTFQEKDTEMAEAVLEVARTHVLTYCNIRKIPKPLYHVVIALAVGEFLYRKKLTGTLSEGQEEGLFEFDPVITRYEAGGETVEFAGPSKYSALSPEAAFDDMVGTLRNLQTYELELQQFRRLPWSNRKPYWMY